MNEEIEKVAPEQTGATESNEATAAAAAFGRNRGEVQPEPVVETVEEVQEVPEVVEEPKVLAGMTEKEITELLGEIPKYRKQIDNQAGHIGKLNAALQKLQQEAPRGEPVVVTDDDMAELMGEYPELAGMTKTALNKALGRMNTRGTGQAAPTPAHTPEDIVALAKKAASEVAVDERVKTHRELLDGLHKGWDSIVGLPDEKTRLKLIAEGKSEDEALAGSIPETEYRKWLATQPAEYRDRLLNTNNAFEIGSSIKAFTEAKEASAKKQVQNKQRLANAVQPSGQVAVRSTISEQSAADKAFNARRQRT
jgi:hypothetical protein